MALVVANTILTSPGEQIRLNWLNTTARYHLYTNNYAPVHTSVLGDFTELTNVEFPGYGFIDVNNFGLGVTVADLWTTVAPMIMWQPSSDPPAPIQIWGYYVTSNSGLYWFAEYFLPGPYTISIAAQQLQLIPTFTLRSQF